MKRFIGAALSLGLLLAPCAHAEDLPLAGGAGTPFRAQCPAGQYLVGFSGSDGAFIDSLRPLCAAWNADTKSFDAPVEFDKKFGGAGGAAYRIECPRTMAIRELRPLAGSEPKVIRGIRNIYCYAPAPSKDTQGLANLGPEMTEYTDRGSTPQYCEEGMAIGVYGRGGRYLSAIGLICGPAPQAPQ